MSVRVLSLMARQAQDYQVVFLARCRRKLWGTGGTLISG